LSISFNKTCSWELVSVTSSVFSFKSETVVIAVYVDVVFNTLLVAFVFWFKVSDDQETQS
jgi:hypothetical protein